MKSTNKIKCVLSGVILVMIIMPMVASIVSVVMVPTGDTSEKITVVPEFEEIENKLLTSVTLKEIIDGFFKVLVDTKYTEHAGSPGLVVLHFMIDTFFIDPLAEQIRDSIGNSINSALTNVAGNMVLGALNGATSGLSGMSGLGALSGMSGLSNMGSLSGLSSMSGLSGLYNIGSMGGAGLGAFVTICVSGTCYVWGNCNPTCTSYMGSYSN